MARRGRAAREPATPATPPPPLSGARDRRGFVDRDPPRRLDYARAGAQAQRAAHAPETGARASGGGHTRTRREARPPSGTVTRGQRVHTSLVAQNADVWRKNYRVRRRGLSTDLSGLLGTRLGPRDPDHHPIPASGRSGWATWSTPEAGEPRRQARGRDAPSCKGRRLGPGRLRKGTRGGGVRGNAPRRRLRRTGLLRPTPNGRPLGLWRRENGEGEVESDDRDTRVPPAAILLALHAPPRTAPAPVPTPGTGLRRVASGDTDPREHAQGPGTTSPATRAGGVRSTSPDRDHLGENSRGGASDERTAGGTAGPRAGAVDRARGPPAGPSRAARGRWAPPQRDAGKSKVRSTPEGPTPGRPGRGPGPGRPAGQARPALSRSSAASTFGSPRAEGQPARAGRHDRAA